MSQDFLHIPTSSPTRNTLPKTNSSPLKMVVSNRNLLFQGAPIFKGEMLVSGRVSSTSWEKIKRIIFNSMGYLYIHQRCQHLSANFRGFKIPTSQTLASPKLTAFSPLKMDGWKTILSYWGFGLFSGANSLLFSGRVPSFF